MSVITELTASLIVLLDELTSGFMAVPPVNVVQYCNVVGIDVSFSGCGQALSDLLTMLLVAGFTVKKKG